eukprot:10084939-Lingulodinium_polyedra.AAC.1
MEPEPGGAGPEQGNPGSAQEPQASGGDLRDTLTALDQQLTALRAQREQRCGPYGPRAGQYDEL